MMLEAGRRAPSRVPPGLACGFDGLSRPLKTPFVAEGRSKVLRSEFFGDTYYAAVEQERSDGARCLRACLPHRLQPA